VSQQRLSAPLAAVEALPDAGTDAIGLARLTLAEGTDLIPAGSGFLPENWLLEAVPASELTRLVKKRRAQPWLPCPPQGLIELREHIAARLVQNGIAAGTANLMTTFGASQAFDLLARILFSPGDAVLVEDPGYFVLFEQLRAHHVRLIPVPRHSAGPDLAVLEAACRAASVARLLHADPAAQSDRFERGRRALPSHSLARGAVRLCDRGGRRLRRLCTRGRRCGWRRLTA
jgi:DNA-binding transcriptional MocR family regulator